MGEMSGKISVLVCDDSELIRTGVKRVLQNSCECNVVGSADDGVKAIEQALSLRPDVVVMDIAMPRLNGIDATTRIKDSAPATRILMLTSAHDEQSIIAAFASGAESYCLKEGPLRHIGPAVIATAAGASWLDPAIAHYVLRHCGREGSVSSTRNLKLGMPDDRVRLSAREVDVLQLVAQGLSNAEIGQHLGLSAETVKTHMKHIMEKLLVADRTQAAVKAIRDGLISTDDV